MEHLTGRLTLVFTDLEGSSELSERHGAAYESVRNQHFELLRREVAQRQGYEVETAGDSLFVVFARPADAVHFAVDAQRAMQNYAWPEKFGAIRVRIGMHTGEPFVGNDQGRATYRGPVTNRAARVQAAGHGGQILVSQSTYEGAQFDLPPEIGFEDCGLHRLKGVGEEHLWQVCHPDLPREFASLNTLNSTLNSQRHNLPAPLTPLIGRQEKIAQWHEALLQPAIRLLTLVAFGGMGKTRAALHLAELCVGDFNDGVWWVALDEAHNADDMIARLSLAVGLQPQPQPSVREQLFTFLRERRLLLVLDNTEQIPDAAGVVNDLLRAAPQVKCVVTSRRALGLQVEQIKELSPLSPDEAQRLFVERARARRADFDVTPDNRRDVAEICSRVEGVPLALELAASRIGTISPREILKHLDHRFKILQTRAPDLPARQRALRGTMDWSYDLLTEDDRALFAQLAVFARGFWMEDAEAVCDPLTDVFEGVEELRGQSLLGGATDAATQQTRFSMLESVRDYALEKLHDRGELNGEVRQRHAEHFRDFARTQIDRLGTAQESDALQQFEVGYDNVRTAMEWARQQMQHQLCAQLALSLGLYLQRRGLLKEAVQRVETGLDAARQGADEESREANGRQANMRLTAQLLRERAGLHLDQLSPSQTRCCAEESLALFERLDDFKGQGETYNLLGLAAKTEQSYDDARRCFAVALELFRRVPNELGVAIVLTNVGTTECEDAAGDKAIAAQRLQEALVLRRRLGDERGVAEVLNNLGVLSHEADDFEQAWRYYEEALQYERRLKNSIGVGRVLYNLSEIAETKGDLEHACRLATAADYMFDAVGSPLKRYASDLCCRVAACLSLDEQAQQALRQDTQDKTLDDLISWSLNPGSVSAKSAEVS